jgi:hypothetical protein
MTEVKISKTIERPENLSYLAWVNYVQTELQKTQEKNLKTELRSIRYGGNYILKIEMR